MDDLSPKVLIRPLTVDDVPQLMPLLKLSAERWGHLDRFDPVHGAAHLEDRLKNGVGFAAYAGEEIVGVIMCVRVDFGYMLTNDLSTEHFFVAESARSPRIAKALMDALDAYADANRLFVYYNVMDYQGTALGVSDAAARVGKLYLKRGYYPAGVATIRRPSFAPSDMSDRGDAGRLREAAE